MTTRELARSARKAAADLELGVTEDRLTTLERLIDELSERFETTPSSDPAVRATLEAISGTFSRVRGAVTA